MDATTIKFKTIQFINGIKYLSTDQVDDLCIVICEKFSIEKNEKNFSHIRDACTTYFNIQNNLKFSMLCCYR